MKEKTIYSLLIFPVIKAPLFEEIIFRLWLKYSRVNLSITSGVVTYVVTRLIYHEYLFDNLIHAAVSIMVTTVVTAMTFLGLKDSDKWLSLNWHKYYRLMAVMSSLSFGYYHIFNFVLTKEFILYSPIILGPFITTGLIYVYMRIRIGFGYTLALHSLNNFIFYGIQVFFR